MTAWPVNTIYPPKSQLWAQKCQLWTSQGLLQNSSFSFSPPPSPPPKSRFIFKGVPLTFSSFLEAFLICIKRVPSTALCISSLFLLVCIIVPSSSSAPCTSLEAFLVCFWTTCWLTRLHPARPSLAQVCAPLPGQVFVVTGWKVDVSPGSQHHPTTFFLLLSAPLGLVCYASVYRANSLPFICICFFVSV